MKNNINLLIFIFTFIILILIINIPVCAETKTIEGKVSTQEDLNTNQKPDVTEQETKVIKSGIIKDVHKSVDVEVLKVAFYYNPDAEIYYELLKEQGQKQYPHLLGYKEIDGLYLKALSESEAEEELKEWKYQGGPRPYYFNIGTEIRNNGSGAMTDVKIRFDIEAKVATLRASSSTLTTDYSDLSRNSRWTKWLTKVVNIEMLPPGEYMMIHTDNISLAKFFQQLNGKWPETIRVKVYAYSPMDGKKNNNSGFKSIQLIPDHFVIKTLH
ncbi:MAG: hypothetical protein AB1782_10350 [Cyanobacteriota bacterium]